MPAPDLIPTLGRVAAMAREMDAAARKPGASYTAASEAILAELTGAAPAWQWRAAVGPDAAAVVCLSKAVRVLAAMLAAREGVSIPIGGVLDDMAEAPPDDPRNARRERRCLGCGESFASEGAANRLCEGCTGALALAVPENPAKSRLVP